MSTRSFRPSPAFVVATLALVVALGGTAFAAPLRRLAASIDGSTIKDHSITGDKLKNNTVTGAQVKEASLATVPSATTADTVGGVTVRKVFYAPKTNSTTPETILELGGLVLTATCANGDLEVVMTSKVDHAHLSSEMWNSAGDGSADGLAPLGLRPAQRKPPRLAR